MNYPLIAEVDDVGLLAAPFLNEPAAVDESRRLWLGRDMLDRWTGIVLLFIFLLEV